MGPDYQPTVTRSKVRVIAQRAVAPAVPPLPLFPSHEELLPPTSSGQITSESDSEKSQSGYLQSMLAAIDVLARVLSARMILLLSVGGALGMAYLAMENPSTMTIAIQGVYDLTIVGPLVWLTATRN